MQAEAIYKGATRPAMKLCIPLVPLVILFGTGMLLIMWGGILVSWWLALGVVLSIAPVLLWMRWLTACDDQRFRQIFVALKLKLHDRNRRFWRARSYSPTLYREGSNVWHVWPVWQRGPSSPRATCCRAATAAPLGTGAEGKP